MVWQNDHFASMFTLPSVASYIYSIMMPLLLDNVSWNRTINKMRANVLELLMNKNPEKFEEYANMHWFVC